MSLLEIPKSIPQNLNYSKRNKILPKNDTQKSGNSQKNETQKSENSPKRYQKIREQPQKSTQNDGTSPYRDICKLPPPPPEVRSRYDIVAFSPPVHTETMKTIMKTQTKLDLFENARI